MSLPFTQTKEYLSWHDAVGHRTFYKEFFRYENIDSGDEIEFQISDLGDREKEIEKNKKLVAICASLIIETRIGKILYVPYGPYFPLSEGEGQEVRPGYAKGVENEIQTYLYNLAKKENCFFVRLESPEKKENIFSLAGRSYGRKYFSFFSGNSSNNNLNQNTYYLFHPPVKTFAKEGIFQPRVEWWLDLEKNEEEIFNNFHKDHRYSIRRAEKEKIIIEIVTENLENYFEIFWELLNTTAKRDGFSLYEERYYRQIFTPGKAGGIEKFLVFTKDDEGYLSVALVVICDGVANLIFAGSASEKRELGYNHTMQWEAIKKSKKLGAKIYNFGGITDGIYGKKSLAGVTKFKQKFGGYKKNHGNFIDIPVQKSKYFLYLLKKVFS